MDLTAGMITKIAMQELERRNCFVWRSNNLPVPGRKFIGLKGVPDICGFNKATGMAVYCEVKTKNDKLSEFQINFMNRASQSNCLCLIAIDENGSVKIKQWEKIEIKS